MAEREMLIAAVYKRPGLYDRTDKLYANRQYTSQAWKEISCELQIEENQARKMWANLRDYFFRHHKELHSTREGSKKRKIWALYDSMYFLVNHLSNKSPTGDAQTQLQDSDSNSSGDGADTPDINFSSPVPQERGSVSPASPASATSATEYDNSCSPAALSALKRKLKPGKDGEADGDPNFINRKILKTLKSISRENTTREDDDEDYSFFKSLVPKMKCMTDIQKLELQAEINAVFLKHLKRAQNQARQEPVPVSVYPDINMTVSVKEQS